MKNKKVKNKKEKNKKKKNTKVKNKKLKNKKFKNKKEGSDFKRYRIKICGIVQGVGFRPFVYQKASQYQIHGWVENSGGAVLIDCYGSQDNIKHFLLNVVKKPPSLASIEKVECISMDMELISDEDSSKHGFMIRESSREKEQIRFIAPDVATCPKCLEDMNRKNRDRYRYPFINCTECGPRFSIIEGLPYDRNDTTMKSFSMCEECENEYNNPQTRRFHAQPTCCEKCGPKITLMDRDGEKILCEDVIKETINLLQRGKILAIKGIGGFQFVCDARNEQAIQLLRSRKHRQDKPFAVMAKDIQCIKANCSVSKKEEEILTNNKKPIVILKKRSTSTLLEVIAPRQDNLGVMLPNSPMHYLLFEGKLEFLIVTSGNLSGMPIEYKNEEATKQLCGVADYFLVHNRDIHIPIDDSVVRVMREVELITRRARGYTPYSAKIETKEQIIAVGAEQKSTFCVSKNGYVHLSQYLGDLEELGSYENFQYVLMHFIKIFDMNASIFVHDMHPSYLSTRYAASQKKRNIAVQHHHAHMVSCMAEHSIWDDVIGVIFDGTGFGIDDAIWGGEFLIGNRSSFIRAGQLEYVSIQGENQAVKEPWRCAVSYLHALGYDAGDIMKGVETEKIEVVKRALSVGLNCFISSSIGRLFDAVAALIGVRDTITYEGQLAIELENMIDLKVHDSYSWEIKEKEDIFRIQYKDIIRGVVRDVQRNEAPSKIATKFHNTLIAACCCLVCNLRKKEGINKVVLSGGVFANQYLLNAVEKILRENDFQVFYNEKIPINDAGISFGQIHVASAILEKEGEVYVPCNTSSD